MIFIFPTCFISPCSIALVFAWVGIRLIVVTFTSSFVIILSIGSGELRNFSLVMLFISGVLELNILEEFSGSNMMLVGFDLVIELQLDTDELLLLFVIGEEFDSVDRPIAVAVIVETSMSFEDGVVKLGGVSSEDDILSFVGSMSVEEVSLVISSFILVAI